MPLKIHFSRRQNVKKIIYFKNISELNSEYNNGFQHIFENNYHD